MKHPLLISLLLFVFQPAAFSQKKKFDVFKFTEPAGWKKEDKNGMLVFTATDEQKGTYCLISLYANSPSMGTIDKDFDAGWMKIATQLSITNPPEKQPGEESNKWKVISGASTFTQNGTTSAVVLSTFTGYGKTASVLFSFNDAAFQKTLEDFSASLEVLPPAASGLPVNPVMPPATGNMLNSGMNYTVPKGWTEVKKAGGASAISSPLLDCKDYSYYTIHVLPVVTYTGNLQEYARDLHKSRFYEYTSWRQYMEGDKRMLKGIDINGQEYFSFETSAALFDSDKSYHYGLVYLVRSGDQLASFLLELHPISNVNHSPPTELLHFTAGCPPLKNAWNKFTASIKFKAVNKSQQYIPDDLLGKWESRIILGATNWGLVNSQVMNQYIFLEDGRYQSKQLMKSDSYGKYSVSGNKLNITNAGGKKVSYQFKLESKYEYGNWKRELTLFDATGKETTLQWEGE
jgi:hypothetical protein